MIIKIKIRHIVILGLIIVCYCKYNFSLYGILTCLSTGFCIIAGSNLGHIISYLVESYIAKHNPEDFEIREQDKDNEK